MRRNISSFDPRGVIVASAVALMTLSSPPALGQQALPADFTSIVRQKTPAVVAVTTKQRVEEQDQAQSIPDDLPFREFFRRFYEDRPDRGNSSSRVRHSARAS